LVEVGGGATRTPFAPATPARAASGVRSAV
jgi:hypothetical protein